MYNNKISRPEGLGWRARRVVTLRFTPSLFASLTVQTRP